jgi:transposase
LGKTAVTALNHGQNSVTVIDRVAVLAGQPCFDDQPHGLLPLLRYRSAYPTRSRCRALDRQTGYLLPPSVEDWLPEDHLARFVVEVIAQLDLSELGRAYAGRGKAAYHPEVLLGLLVYGYAAGVFSSRKIERATYDSVALRYIAANTHPDHDTLATFRKRFASQIEKLFVQVLLVAKEMKRVKLGQIALDGTKC